MLFWSLKDTDLRNPPPACFEFPVMEEVLHRRFEDEEPFRFRIPDCDCELESAGADTCLATLLNDEVEVLDRRNLPNPNLTAQNQYRSLKVLY